MFTGEFFDTSKFSEEEAALMVLWEELTREGDLCWDLAAGNRESLVFLAKQLGLTEEELFVIL